MDYGDEDGDGDVIALTHVCQAWRSIFTSRSSLWTQFGCVDADKTRVYLERSKSSPIKLELWRPEDQHLPPHDPLLQIVPHATGRLTSLCINAAPGNLSDITAHLSSPAPLLESLMIDGGCEFGPERNPTLTTTLFNGNLSSLHTLHLQCVRTELPWRNMGNLTSFAPHHTQPGEISISCLLDFLESAPHLQDIRLRFATPASGGQDGRLVSLACLKRMDINGDEPSSLLLNHLVIPVGAKLATKLAFSGLLIEDHLPRSLDNLKNLSNFTKIHIRTNGRRSLMEFIGPNGEVSVEPMAPQVDLSRLVLEFLAGFDTSKTEELEILRSNPPASWIPHRALLPMKNLRVLTLSRCTNPHVFIHALNPELFPSDVIVCPELKELIFVLSTYGVKFDIGNVIGMAAARESRGAKLMRVRILDRSDREFDPDGVLELERYVSHVECGPGVDVVNDDGDSSDEDSIYSGGGPVLW